MATRVLIKAAMTVSLAAAMTAGVLAAPALAAASTSSHAASAARLPLSAAQLKAAAQLHDAAQATGSITGVARTAAGAPLASVCVTAYGPKIAKSAVTDRTGRFVITGLRAGQYQVRYRSCGGSATQFLPEWYGGSLQRSQSRSVVITGSRLTPLEALAPQTLYPANSVLGALPGAVIPQHGSSKIASDPFGRHVTGTASSAALIKWLTARTGAHLAPSAAHGKPGRIAGVVTSPAGQGLAGICVVAYSTTAQSIGFAVTGKQGSYATGKLPAGKYALELYAQCGNTGNWLTQIYKGIYNPNKTPTLVPIKAGQTTKNVDAVMKDGGEISGTVTGPGGRRLSDICVSPLTNSLAGTLVFQAVSSRGVYHIRGVPPGSYQLGFAACGGEDFAPTLWPGTQNYNVAPYITVHPRQIIANIDEIMQLGGVISGTVTSATTPPAPLAGMCVFVSENNGLFDNGSASTDANGNYTITGLAAGPYSVYFQPGCTNNANYVAESYPSNVKVASGVHTSGINGSLPVGATISGTVTSASTGKPLAGICVQIDSAENGPVAQAVTAADGTYSVNQLPVDTYEVQFSGGCGNTGSYAPQGYQDTNVLEPQNIDVTTAGQIVPGVNAALQPGPVIAGTVTNSSGRRLSGICVFAVTPSGIIFGLGVTARGGYQIPDLEPAQYQVVFAPGCGNNANLVQQAYKTPAAAVTPATVAANSGTVRGIDARMTPAGGMSGTVRSASGHAVQFYCMILTGVSGSARSLVGEAVVFGSKYEITGMPLGAYQVAFAPSCLGSRLETQWYQDQPGPAHATSVAVRANRVTPHIDASLLPGGSIGGRLTSSGTPIGDMCIFAQSITQLAESGSGITNSNGYYVIHGLNSGDYELYVFPCGNAASAYASEVVPQIVPVTAPQRTSGVRSNVPLGATIDGTALAGSPASAAAGVCVEAIQTNGSGYNAANTALDGTFSIPNLPPGSYRVYFGDQLCSVSPPDLTPNWFQDQASEQASQLLTVTVGSTSSLGADTLTTDGSISGTVTGPHGARLRGVCVAAVQTGVGAGPVYSVTGPKGTYSIIDLVPGQYRVEFTSGCGATGYKTQWWNDKATMSAATIATVTTGTTTTGISAALSK